MTQKMKWISICRDLAAKQEWSRLDAAVQDLISIRRDYRNAAKIRLRRMRATSTRL